MEQKTIFDEFMNMSKEETSNLMKDHFKTMENKIRVYDIDYLYLTDEKYARGFNTDNDFNEDEIKEHIEHLKNNRQLILNFEHWYLTQDEWNDKEHMEGEMVNLIEQETGEYFEGFEWEYLVESN
jgi:hypothetical protein